MIVSSTVVYGAPTIDPTLTARSTQTVDPFDPQTPPPPSSATSSQTIISSQPGSLLSSSTAAEVLNLTDTATLSTSTAQKPKAITHEDVLNAVKRSKSYAAGNASDGNRLGEMYTSKDVGFIRATTGYNVISIGKLTAIVDDDGSPLPPDTENSATQIAFGIENARRLGVLTGEITPEFAKNMISSYASMTKSFPKDWLNNALTYLGGTTDSQPAKV